MTPRRRILLCGETHSSNLGDQVICGCLSHLLIASGTDVSVKTFDISLRTGHAEPPGQDATSTSWRRPHRLLYSRSYTYRSRLNRLSHIRGLGRYESSLEEALRDIDLVILGGGQLVQDSALSFPLKLDVLVRECGDRGIPVVLFSVGVGTKWSRRGWKLCDKVMSAPIVQRVYCRDHGSAEFLRGRLGQAAAGKVRTTFDVALLAGRVYPTARRDDGLVGIGVISPSFTTRIDPRHPLSERRWSMAFYRELCSILLERGERVELFTNGVAYDQQFAEAINGSLQRAGYRSAALGLADRPRSAGALVDRISCYGRIIAGRLHANVIAESLGTPWVGFGWDEKVMAFGRMVNKEGCVIGVPRNARSVLEHCSACFAEAHRRESNRELWETRLRKDMADVLNVVAEGGYEALDDAARGRARGRADDGITPDRVRFSDRPKPGSDDW